VKAKLREHVRTRSDVAMKNEVYCKFICHNICCVIMEQCVLGIEACFSGEDQQQEPEGDRMILKLRAGHLGRWSAKAAYGHESLHAKNLVRITGEVDMEAKAGIA